jgi:tetratricopeptide (TPR) repeat protein
MKARRIRSQRFLDAGKAPPKKTSPAPAEPASASKIRRWGFRILALLSPVLLLGLGELGLRLAGYGYATSFFLEKSHDGRRLLVENPKFGWRFFPPAVARSPLPLSLDAPKPPGTVRIFVFGESAAMGDPEPAYGFARQLERILQARDPGQKFEVVNTAMTAINSIVIREIARDCAPRQGDFWVIYAGNNEVVGPFGAGTVFGRQTPGLPFIRASLLMKSTRLGQWLEAWRTRSDGRMEWRGMEMFLQNQVRSDAPGLQIVHQNFARNLADIVSLGRRSGATVLMTTVPVNLKDCPPFASQHRPDLSAGQLGEWNEIFQRGRQAQAAGRFAEALTNYAAAGQIDVRFAELPFRRAVCELALGRTNAAGDDYRLACDEDTLRFRADSIINQTIREVAAAQGITLVDAEEECARQSADGLPGDALFYDHVHLNFSGNYLVAQMFAAEIEKKLAGSGIPAVAPMPTQADIARRLAFTDFDRRRVGEEMRLRLQQPPFTYQINSRTRDEQWRETLARWETPLARADAEYQDALKLAPDDWVLHANYARLLEASEDDPAAARQWQEVARLMPYEPDAWFQLGNLAYTARAFADAQDFFQKALERKPGLPEGMNGLGLSLAAQGKVDEAMREFKAALRLNPSFSAARVDLAVTLANQGKIPEAMAEYRTVLQRDTNNVAARINLAKLLASQSKGDEAMVLLKEALVLKPDEPVANFDLANELVAQNRRAEALPYYQAAVRAKPDFAEARFNLAMELARAGNFAEALPQLAEVVRLQPDFVNARFNYGIALAKEHRYAEAVKQFQETLQRQPDHAAAKAALERARKLANDR